MSSNPTRKALLIGINYTGTEDELNGCINDVANIKDFLMSVGYLEEEITVLCDNQEIKPTSDQILHELEKLVTSGKDRLFFSYSGHGSRIPDTPSPIFKRSRPSSSPCRRSKRLRTLAYSQSIGDEIDGFDETICSLDRNISDDELRSYIDKIPSTSSMFAIFDSCHSGTCLDLMCTLTYDVKVNHLSAILNPRVEKTKAQVVFISGCYDNQTSSDTVEEGLAQGALTWSFLKSIREKYLTHTKREIIVDIIKRLVDKEYLQRPQISFGRDLTVDEPFSF